MPPAAAHLLAWKLRSAEEILAEGDKVLCFTRFAA
jgi:hypothetical protein